LVINSIETVVADTTDEESGKVFTGLVRGAHDMKHALLVRWAFKEDSDIKMGVLWPIVKANREFFYFGQVCVLFFI